GRTGPFQHAHRAPEVDGVAVAGIRVDDQWQVDDLADRGGVRGHVGDRDEAEIGQAEVGVGDARSGEVDRVEAEVLDDPRGQRVGGTGQQQAVRPGDQLAQASGDGVLVCGV